MGCFNSNPAPATASAPAPLQETPGTFSSDPDISRSWVYFKIIENGTNQIYYAYNVHLQKCLRFPHVPEVLLNSATVVLNGKLYVIGGTDLMDSAMASNNVYICDPVTFTWSQLPSTHTPRQNAVAVAANGKIYVFGGWPPPNQVKVRWAEVYDPSSSPPGWTAIPHPPHDFSSSLSRHPLQAVVFKHRIFVRNDCREIAYNMISSMWEILPPVFSNYWFKWPSSAAEVSGMFVAYHRQGNGRVALRAYDPGRGLWLPLDLNPVIRAEMGQLLSVNGSLVEYRLRESPSQLTFTVMQMQVDSIQNRIAVRIANTFTYLPESANCDLTGPGYAGNP